MKRRRNDAFFCPRAPRGKMDISPSKFHVRRCGGVKIRGKWHRNNSFVGPSDKLERMFRRVVFGNEALEKMA